MSFNNLESLDFDKELQSDSSIILIDCRTPSEFQGGHIPNAINYDFNSGELATNLQNLNKDSKYFIYCRSGARSSAAAGLMVSQGINNVTNLVGGILGWQGEIV